MLCLLVTFPFSFGAACCFRFIPVFWVHVFAWFVLFPLGPRAVFISFGGILCFFQFAVVTFLHVKFLAVFFFGLMWLLMEGFLSEPRDIYVNPKDKRSGCCVRPGISV